MTSSPITIRIIASLRSPALLIALSSRAELRIQILRGILPISCPHCPIMNTIYQLDLQKLFYDANINSYQHALLCVRHHAKHYIMYIILAPLI